MIFTKFCLHCGKLELIAREWLFQTFSEKCFTILTNFAKSHGAGDGVAKNAVDVAFLGFGACRLTWNRTRHLWFLQNDLADVYRFATGRAYQAPWAYQCRWPEGITRLPHVNRWNPRDMGQHACYTTLLPQMSMCERNSITQRNHIFKVDKGFWNILK